jgi:hypothetical protein
MAAKRGMMAEHDVLHKGLARFHGLEKLPQMGAQIVIVVAFIADGLGRGFLAGLGVVLSVPLLKVGVLQTAR